MLYLIVGNFQLSYIQKIYLEQEMIYISYALTVNPRSLSEQAADRIEALVIDQTFKRGEKIPSENELSVLLNVGRSTVREAIKILVTRNILEIRRGFGTYVCEQVGMIDDPLGFRFAPDQHKLALDLCEIRSMIEPQLAYRAASNATDDEIEEIQTLCTAVAELISQGKYYGDKDIEFHTKIADCSGNLVVPRLIPIINSAIDSYMNMTNSALAGSAAITHQQIADAIRRHDADGARDAMAQHLKDNYDTLVQLHKT